MNDEFKLSEGVFFFIRSFFPHNFGHINTLELDDLWHILFNIYSGKMLQVCLSSKARTRPNWNVQMHINIVK